MKIYSIKIALHGVSPMVWRRLDIPENTSLSALHHTIQIAYGWDDDHLHQFHIYGKDYGISYSGSIAFADNPEQVFLADFEFDVGDKFRYEYNFFIHCLVDIRIEKIKDVISQSVILCIKGNGMPGVDKYDEAEALLNFVHAIAKANRETLLADILPFVEACNATKFNRHTINQQLQSTLT